MFMAPLESWTSREEIRSLEQMARLPIVAVGAAGTVLVSVHRNFEVGDSQQPELGSA